MKGSIRFGGSTAPVRVAFAAIVLAVLLTGCGAPAAPAELPTVQPGPATEVAAPSAPTSEPTSRATAVEATPPPTESPTVAASSTEAPAAASPAGAGAVSFKADVMPVFEERCIKCHGGKETKGGLVLKTYADMMKGGEDGQVVVPGDPTNSLLVQLIENGKMPRRESKLPQEQIDLISKWVEQGAQNN